MESSTIPARRPTSAKSTTHWPIGTMPIMADTPHISRRAELQAALDASRARRGISTPTQATDQPSTTPTDETAQPRQRPYSRYGGPQPVETRDETTETNNGTTDSAMTRATTQPTTSLTATTKQRRKWTDDDYRSRGIKTPAERVSDARRLTVSVAPTTVALLRRTAAELGVTMGQALDTLLAP